MMDADQYRSLITFTEEEVANVGISPAIGFDNARVLLQEQASASAKQCWRLMLNIELAIHRVYWRQILICLAASSRWHCRSGLVEAVVVAAEVGRSSPRYRRQW